jgi:hypothetical protein
MSKKHKKKKSSKHIGEIKNVTTTIPGLFEKRGLDDDRSPLPKADIISIKDELFNLGGKIYKD